MNLIKNKIIIAILASIAVFGTSCEQDAKNVTIPTIEPQLVVNCFLSPQDPEIRAWVSLSRPIFGTINQNNEIVDADVKLSDGTNTVTLTYTPKKVYTISSAALKIEGGKTYTLFVSAVGKTVKATCTVPVLFDTTSITLKWDTTFNIKRNEGVIERTVRLDIGWKDKQNGEDFYRVGADAMVYTVVDTTNITFQRLFNNEYTDLVSDKNKDGETLRRSRLETTVNEYFGGITGTFSLRIKGLKMYLLSCDKNYYLYHKSAEVNTGGDPFTEPVLVYSNVQGGLGCFGASNQYIKEINF